MSYKLTRQNQKKKIHVYVALSTVLRKWKFILTRQWV